MLLDTPNPYPPKEVENLKQWLRQPAAMLFQKHIGELAGQMTAHAGNFMVSGEPSDLQEAQDCALAARIFIEMVNVMTKMRNDADYPLHGYSFTPKPINSPTEEKNNASQYSEVRSTD